MKTRIYTLKTYGLGPIESFLIDSETPHFWKLTNSYGRVLSQEKKPHDFRSYEAARAAHIERCQRAVQYAEKQLEEERVDLVKALALPVEEPTS